MASEYAALSPLFFIIPFVFFNILSELSSSVIVGIYITTYTNTCILYIFLHVKNIFIFILRFEITNIYHY